MSVAAYAQAQDMVAIPEAEFKRGRTHSLPDDGLKWWPELLQDDRPVKTIHVSAFRLDRQEVTIAQYAKFVATGHRAPYNWVHGKPPADRANYAVAGVDWNDAQAYCAWAGKRLPTEAEWERAARGTAEGAKNPWGDREPTRKDACYDTSFAGPCESGAFPPNEFGLLDMAGGVWEWTADWYARDYYSKAPSRNPKGPAEGQYRVIRGGSWADVAKYLTSAYRGWARPLERSPNIGFRCAQ
ncbi:MAG: SUMF1/EgtB/PvdO family nonheme iron enzyme [Bryobacteraceae bacterium]